MVSRSHPQVSALLESVVSCITCSPIATSSLSLLDSCANLWQGRQIPATLPVSSPVCPGVSNFGLSELQELFGLAKVKPAALEARSDPFAVNHHLINICIEHNMTFIGFSTLGTQWINSPAAVNPVHSNDILKVGGRAKAESPRIWIAESCCVSADSRCRQQLPSQLRDAHFAMTARTVVRLL